MHQFTVISHNELNYESIALESKRLDACLIEMKKRNIRNISINDYSGWDNKTSLDFLGDNLWIEGVEIVAKDIDI